MIYSHSKISCYETCPLQYKYKYVDRLMTTMGVTIEAFMGIRVHAALEKLYRALLMTRRYEMEELIRIYHSEWEKFWGDDIRVIRKEYSPNDYRRKGAKCIENYYRRYFPFNQAQTLGIEERIQVKLSSDHLLTGFIDRLDRVDDGIYEIHDYKTSNRLPTQDEIDHDRQLALYQIDIQARWDDVEKVILVWHYLIFDRELRSIRNRAAQEEILKKTNQVIDLIEADDKFKPQPSAVCDWCDFQNICPIWKHKFHLENLPPRRFREDEGLKLVDRYVGLLDEEHLLKEEKEKSRSEIIEYCKFFGYDIIYGSDRNVKIKKVRDLDFSTLNDKRRRELEDLMETAGCREDFSSFNINKLKKALEKGTIPDSLAARLRPYYDEKESVRLYISKTKPTE